MATAGATSALGLSEVHKRWLVFGIALNKILVPNLRPHVEQGVLHEYVKVTTSHNIHTQSTSGRLQRWPRLLKYENINGNDAQPRLHGGKLNYALFDCRVTSHVDFAKLYLQNHMAKFNAFDEHCDASALLVLLGGVPGFSAAVHAAADDVRESRNAWAHCDFSEWNAVVFQQSFQMMEQLVKDLGLPSADQGKLLRELKNWETTGTTLCMNSPVDPALLHLIQHHVNTLQGDLCNLTFELEEQRNAVRKALQDGATKLQELETRVSKVETEQEGIKQEIMDMQSRFAHAEEKQSRDGEDVSDRTKCIDSEGIHTQYKIRKGWLSPFYAIKARFKKKTINKDLIESIRQLCKTREGRLSPFHWCEDFHFQLNDIYTRLKIVNREKTRHTVTEQITNVTGIFRAHEECKKPRTVLIEAQPGMGKSVYCQKLAYDWATERVTDPSFPQIKVLLLLRCHEITTNIWEAIDDQILPRSAREEEKQSFFNFIRANQSKVLLVLDGLDEIPSSRLPMFSDLFEGRELPGCHIVVTARQGAGMKVRKYSDTLLEIVGFTEEDARLFICKYFKNMEDLAEKLSYKLQTDKSLKEMIASPLNTALLCLLCEDYEGVFPRSRTYLYIEIVRCILRRFRKRNGLPTSDEDLVDVYKEQLKRLGLVALNGLRNDKFFFDDDELGGQISDIPDFGFLSVQTGRSKRRPRRCYAFPHKSFQEFFAGFYLCYGFCEGEIELESLVADRSYFEELEQVLLFTIGVTASRFVEKSVHIIKSIAKQVNVLAAMRGAKEKGNAGYEHNVHAIRSRIVFALECIQECRTQEFELPKHLACTLGSELELNSLDLSDVVKNDLVELLTEALKVNTTLTDLNLSSNNIGGCAGAVKSLSEALKVNTALTRLDLSDNSIGSCAGVVESLSEALKVNTSLTRLNLSNNKIGGCDGAVESLSEALKKNTTLIDLDLSKNNIGSCACVVESLSEALKVNTSLTALNLSHNKIVAVESLSEVLKVNINLTALNLSNNKIGGCAGAVESLSEALKVNTSLTDLDLSYNNIGSCAGAVESLSEALKVNTSLTRLNLSKNNIGGCAGAVASLSEALKVTTTLTDLYLSQSNMTSRAGAVESLSEALKVNTSLTVLDLSRNNIGGRSGDVESLSEALKVNTTLTDLNLCSNRINVCAGAVKSLSEALELNTSLTVLELCYNNMMIGGCAGAVDSLLGALMVNTSLTVTGV